MVEEITLVSSRMSLQPITGIQICQIEFTYNSYDMQKGWPIMSPMGTI